MTEGEILRNVINLCDAIADGSWEIDTSYSASYNNEEKAWIGLCAALPSLSVSASTAEEAAQLIRLLVLEVVADTAELAQKRVESDLVRFP